MNTKQKLRGKDLINIGIYAAMFCVIVTAIAMLGFIPVMLPMLCVLVPILGGIPYTATINISRTMAEIEHDIVCAVLKKNNMNQSKAAKQLNLSRTTIWRMLQ